MIDPRAGSPSWATYLRILNVGPDQAFLSSFGEADARVCDVEEVPRGHDTLFLSNGPEGLECGGAFNLNGGGFRLGTSVMFGDGQCRHHSVRVYSKSEVL